MFRVANNHISQRQSENNEWCHFQGSFSTGKKNHTVHREETSEFLTSPHLSVTKHRETVTDFVTVVALD